MAKYISNRQQNLKIGIVSYTEDETVLEVIGNVGIGTTNATSKLWVNGDGYFVGVLTATSFFGNGSGLTNLIGVGAGIAVKDSGTVVGTAGTIDFGDNLTVSAISAGIVTVTGSAGGGSSQFVTTAAGIHTLSNVGIGTTNPTSKLHVVGDARITGILTIGTSSVVLDGANNKIYVGSGVTISATEISIGSNIIGSGGFSGNASSATYATNAGIATNLKGGVIGNIPYQSAADTTAFLTNGGSGTILQSNGVGNAPTWVTPAAAAGAITGLTIRDEDNIVSGLNSVSTLNFVGSIVSVASTAGIATITFLDYVSNAGIATFSTNAGIATFATSSGIATYATNAGIATFATSAGIATFSTNAGIATFATSAGIATYATNAGISTFATSAGIATYATNAGIATNLKGGVIGNIPYQSAADTTAFLTNGGSGTILQSNGVGNAPTWVTPAAAAAITGLTIRDEGTIVGGANSVSTLNFVGSIVSVASTAGIATITFLDYVSNAGIATFATSSGIATFATNAGVSTYATNAGIATFSTNAGIATNVIGGISSVTQLNVSGISTFNNGPVLIGGGTSTGTAGQVLQVTGINSSVYIGGSVGLGTTNPTSKLFVVGDVRVSGVVTATTFVGELTGTATSTTNIPNLTGVITSVGTATTLGSFTSAQLATALTDETGSGSAVFATSPTLVTPALGAATATSIVVGSGVTINASGINAAAGIITASQLSTGASGTGININTDTISGPATLTIDPAAVGDNTGAVRIKGDLYVDGTQFIVNSTTIELADFNVGIATTVGTDALLDGAGIGIGSTGIRKTLTWNDTSDSLKSSENFDVASGKVYKVDGTSVLSNTTLGSSVVNSSLTSVGTLGSLSVGNVYSTGIITASSFSGNASSATFATNAGIATNLKGGVIGNIPYQSAADTTAFLTNGDSGKVLQSNGVGNAPTWVTPAAANAITGLTIRDEGTIVGGANSVSTLNFVGSIVSVASTAGIATITFLDYVSNSGIATNLKGGLTGNIHYQSAADTTAFLTNGGSGTILQSNGVGIVPTWVTPAPAGAITGLTISDEGTIVGGANSISALNFVGSIVSVASTAGIATITFTAAAASAGEFNTGITNSVQIKPLSFESSVFTFPSTAGKQYVIETINVANVDTSVGIGTTVNIIASIQDSTGEQTYIAYNVPIVTGGLIELLKNPIVAGPSDVIKMWATNGGYSGVSTALEVYMNYDEYTSTEYIRKYASTVSIATTNITGIFTSTTYASVIKSIHLTNRTDSGDYPVSVTITNGVTTTFLAKDLIIPRYSTVDILDRPKRVDLNGKISIGVGQTSTIDVIIAGKQITS